MRGKARREAVGEERGSGEEEDGSGWMGAYYPVEVNLLPGSKSRPIGMLLFLFKKQASCTGTKAGRAERKEGGGIEGWIRGVG